jgi:hypothetical protein
MPTPTFTAEASLYHGETHYPSLSRGVIPDRPILCMTTWCPFGQLWCYPAIGIWDPVTGSCGGYEGGFHTF